MAYPKDIIESELGKGEDCSIIAIVDQLITYAHQLRSSDVHIDPAKVEVSVDKGLLSISGERAADAPQARSKEILR